EQAIGGQVGRPAESAEVVAVFAGDVLSATSDAVAEGSRDLTEVVAGDLKLLAVLPDQMGVWARRAPWAPEHPHDGRDVAVAIARVGRCPIGRERHVRVITTF